MKALEADRLFPSSTYAVNVATETMTGMELSRNELTDATTADFQSTPSSLLRTPWIRSQNESCTPQHGLLKLRKGRKSAAEGSVQEEPLYIHAYMYNNHNKKLGC